MEIWDSIENLLKYGIPGLSVILFAFGFILLKKESGKVKPNATALMSIRIFLYLVFLLVIAFLGFELFKESIQNDNKKVTSVKNEWLVRGKIELKDENNKTLNKITKDIYGHPIDLEVKEFLEKNLKITTSPEIIYPSFTPESFTITMPKKSTNTDIVFSIKGYRCITDNNMIEMNKSEDTFRSKKMVFMKEKTEYNATGKFLLENNKSSISDD